MPGGRVLVRLSCAGLGVHCAGYPSHQVPQRGGIIGAVANVLGPAVEDATVRNIGCRSRTRFMQAVDRMAALEGFTFECPQVRPGGDPPLRTRGRCAAWQAGSQLSRGGGDRRRHRTPKAHGEAHRQLQARQRAPVSEVADPPLSPTRPALWRSVFGRARGRPDDEKVPPCCPIHHSTNGVVTPRLDLCGATDDLLDHARVAKAVKELGDAFLD